MEYFGGTGTGESLTLTEMIECDMRSNFSEHMGGSGDALGAQTQNLDPSLAVSVSMDFSHQDHGAMASAAGGLDLLDGESKLKDWIHSVHDMDFLKTENTDPNLMVDPQTGVPIQHQQNHHSHQNVAVSSVVTSSASPNLSTADSAQTVINTDQVISIEPSNMDHLAMPIGGELDSPASHQFVQMSAVQPQSPQPHSPIYVTQQQQQHSTTLRQHLQNTLQHHQVQAAFHGLNGQFSPHKVKGDDGQKVYPKPVYSYSCLIAMALKNSETGCLPVSEIYSFMTENFPYFKTAPDGWKNSVRHNLSLNKCFEKIENPKSNGNTRKGCLWAMNPAKIEKMEDEIAKWRKKDPIAIKRSMAKPEVLDLLEKGQGGCRSPHHTGVGSAPSTPTHNNNNDPKTSIHIINSPIPSVTPTITTVNANASILELKPFKMEGIKLEDLNGISGLSSEDLNLLDNSLDPALSDLALQNGLFDDLGSEGINLDDLPISSSPLSFNFTSPGLVTANASSLYTSAGAATPMHVKEEPGTMNSIQGNFVSYTNCNSGVPTSAPSTPTNGNFQISRTVSAQT